jgi:hypothetical protein
MGRTLFEKGGVFGVFGIGGVDNNQMIFGRSGNKNQGKIGRVVSKIRRRRGRRQHIIKGSGEHGM